MLFFLTVDFSVIVQLYYFVFVHFSLCFFVSYISYFVGALMLIIMKSYRRVKTTTVTIPKIKFLYMELKLASNTIISFATLLLLYSTEALFVDILPSPFEAELWYKKGSCENDMMFLGF